MTADKTGRDVGRDTYLKHFDGEYTVVGSVHFEGTNVCYFDLYILQLKIPEPIKYILFRASGNL